MKDLRAWAQRGSCILCVKWKYWRVFGARLAHCARNVCLRRVRSSYSTPEVWLLAAFFVSPVSNGTWHREQVNNRRYLLWHKKGIKKWIEFHVMTPRKIITKVSTHKSLVMWKSIGRKMSFGYFWEFLAFLLSLTLVTCHGKKLAC